MALEQEIQNLVSVIRSAVDNGSMGAGGQSTSGADAIVEQRTKAKQRAQDVKMRAIEMSVAKESTKIFGHFNKSLEKHAKDLNIKYQLLEKSFDDVVESLDGDAIKKLPDTLNKELKNSPVFSHTNISNLEDAFQFFDDLADKKALFSSGAIQQQLSDSTKVTAEQLEILSKVAKKEGITVQEVALKKKEYGKELKESLKIRAKLNDELKGGLEARLADSMDKAKTKFDEVKGSLKALSEGILSMATPAMKFGTDIGDSATAFMSGMNPAEMAQNVATFRQSIQASGMSTDEFRSITEEGASSLTSYTGELKTAVQVQASAFESAKRMGLSGRSEMRAFMDQQVSTFKKFNGVFSMTAEEFVNMNKTLRNSAPINEHMYRLSRKQRANAMQDIQQSILRLRTMGLMQEQAVKVVEAMSAIAAKSPKERLKQAAKLQAVGGAMGFGAEAGEAAQIMRRGFKEKGDRERFAELQQGMQKSMGDFMGQGMGQEMMAAQMIQATQLEELLGPKSAFKELNTEQHQSTKNVESLMKKRVDQGGQMLAWFQRIQMFFNGPLMKILGGILGGIAALGGGAFLKKGLAGAFTGIMKGGGGFLKMAAGGILRMLGPLGILSSIALTVGGMMFSKNAEGGGMETEAEATLWDDVKGFFGVKRSEEAIAKEKETKEYTDAVAKQAAIVTAKAEEELKTLVPKLTRESRSGKGYWTGKNIVNITGDDGKETTINRKDLEGMGAGQQARIGARTRMTEIQKAIDSVTMAKRKAEVKKDKDAIKAREADLEMLKKNFNIQNDILMQLKDPNYKPITDTIKDASDEQKDRDDAALAATKKSVKIQWARSATAS